MVTIDRLWEPGVFAELDQPAVGGDPPGACLAEPVVVAYAAWVSAIPGSPMNSLHWYTPSLGAVIGLAGCAVISLVQPWYGELES